MSKWVFWLTSAVVVMSRDVASNVLTATVRNWPSWITFTGLWWWYTSIVYHDYLVYGFRPLSDIPNTLLVEMSYFPDNLDNHGTPISSYKCYLMKVSCYGYLTLETDKWMGVECWWNGTESGNPKYSDSKMSHCHLVHHRPHTDWSSNQPGATALTDRGLTAWTISKYRLCLCACLLFIILTPNRLPQAVPLLKAPSECIWLRCRDVMLNQTSSDLSEASPVHRTPVETVYFMPL